MRFMATNFLNSSLVFLAMSLVTSRVRADFYIAENQGDGGEIITSYYVVPANFWNCDGIDELQGKFTQVDEYDAATLGTNVISFQVAAGLCGYQYAIDAYIYDGDPPQKYAIYQHNGNGQQIGTCVESNPMFAGSLDCGPGKPGALAFAYCTEDWIC